MHKRIILLVAAGVSAFALAGHALHLQDRADPMLAPGTRCTRERPASCPRGGDGNTPPKVELSAAERKITLRCPKGDTPQTCAPSASQQVQLSVTATDADGDTLLYTYSVTGGRLVGDGPAATWDLTGVRPGTYTATVEVDDRCGCVAFAVTRVKVEYCADCEPAAR